ncbi:MAG: hypothetical protein ACTSSL_12180 [Candidatus Heimdallarchaeaceae archaeon]
MVNGKPLGYFVNASNMVIDQSDYYGQLILINCSHLTIANQNLSYTDIGLFGRYCNYLNITGNAITNTMLLLLVIL